MSPNNLTPELAYHLHPFNEINCPLCKETDFDQIGLNLHFANKHCDVLNTLLASPPIPKSPDPRAWILTHTGRQFFPFAPEPGSIDIQDIAHALAHSCRFTGHTHSFYSIAQHSVLVSEKLDDPYESLWGLLHDASEAYLSDLSKPIKEFLPQYKEIEETLQRAIARDFALAWHPPHGMPEKVKEVDTRMLKTEQRDLMPVGPVHCPWAAGIVPYQAVIDPYPPFLAKIVFLARYEHFKKIFPSLP